MLLLVGVLYNPCAEESNTIYKVAQSRVDVSDCGHVARGQLAMLVMQNRSGWHDEDSSPLIKRGIEVVQVEVFAATKRPQRQPRHWGQEQ